MTKYIFVTGGVASSLGKGIIAASLGNLLKARGFRVTNQKLDPYINVDPGTLNPYEHGGVTLRRTDMKQTSTLGTTSVFWMCVPIRRTISLRDVSIRR